MDDNIQTLLDYLNIPAIGAHVITPTTLYVADGSWMISPEAHGVRVTTTVDNYSVRDMKAYALLMNVIGDSKYIVPYMRDVIEVLIRRVTNCSMGAFILMFDEDKTSIEVTGTLVRHLCESDNESKLVSRRTWRINTEAMTVHQWSPNQWMLESSAWNVVDYYRDIAGCLILLNAINNR